MLHEGYHRNWPWCPFRGERGRCRYLEWSCSRTRSVMSVSRQGRKPDWKFGVGQWQTAFGSKLLTRKTGRVETSYTVEDKNKNVLCNSWPAETKAESAPYLGGHDVLPSLIRHFFWGGGDVSPCPPRDLRPCTNYTVGVSWSWLSNVDRRGFEIIISTISIYLN